MGAWTWKPIDFTTGAERPSVTANSTRTTWGPSAGPDGAVKRIRPWALVRGGAPVSTPLSWDELASLDSPAGLNLFTVPERLASDGDPWAAIDDVHHSLQPLLDLWDEHPVELNFPPDHPKMPGEPPRVQPSKKVDSHWDADGNRIPD